MKDCWLFRLSRAPGRPVVAEDCGMSSIVNWTPKQSEVGNQWCFDKGSLCGDLPLSFMGDCFPASL